MKDAYWLFGARQNVLAGQANTGGRYDLVEGWFFPGAQTPPHRHGAYSEQVYVLDGASTVWAGGREAVLRPGDDLIIPAGTPHAVAATGNGPGRALVVASPSGFARLVTDVGTPDEGAGMPPSAAPDVDLFPRVAAALGDEILGPPGACPTDEDGLSRRTGDSDEPRGSYRAPSAWGFGRLLEPEEARRIFRRPPTGSSAWPRDLHQIAEDPV